MTNALQTPDWFDRLWESSIKAKLPLLLRTEAIKKLAREAVGTATETLGALAKTPEGMRQVVAYGRIFAAVRGLQGVFSSPDPSPEEVAAFVERLVDKVKP